MITISELGFTYARKSTVFSGLSLSIPAGRSVGVLGANGVGKTTLIKLLAGLVSPSQGALTILGFTPRERSAEFYQNLFVVPEESELPPISGDAYVARFSVFYSTFDAQQFKTLANQFDINCEKRLTEMSLGQKKKFLVAFAIATRCKVILMDEPTNGLDIPAKAQFRNMVVQHQTDEQTFLICTHQVRDLESIIDSVVMMNEQHAHWFDLGDLPDKISQVVNPAHGTNILHSEQRMGTQLAIIEGGQAQATDIDLELLFNTFHTNYDGLINAISKEATL